MQFPVLQKVLAASLFLAAMGAAQIPDPARAFSAESKAPANPALAPAQTAPKRQINDEMRGDIAMARKMYREAIDYYRTIQPPTAVAWNKMGIAYHHLMELDAAKRCYEQAIKMKKDYAEAINNLGAVYYAARSYRRATGQYQKALKYTPNSASIYSNLGTAWFARKKYDKAFESYQRALSIDPEVFEHRGSTGVLLQERSVAERAKFHFYLAKTYAKAGNAERALVYMRKCLEEGFKERDRFKEDPEFAGLQQNPEFQELLVSQPRVL
jgi:tetratricopeptide (TPR) repeat protein